MALLMAAEALAGGQRSCCLKSWQKEPQALVEARALRVSHVRASFLAASMSLSLGLNVRSLGMGRRGDGDGRRTRPRLGRAELSRGFSGCAAWAAGCGHSCGVSSTSRNSLSSILRIVLRLSSPELTRRPVLADKIRPKAAENIRPSRTTARSDECR